jgi:hypothetical protein
MDDSYHSKEPLQQVLEQLQFDQKGRVDSNDSLDTSKSASFENLSEMAKRASWVDTYRKFRKPRSAKMWQWSPESRPGKHCDAHLIDFFSCIDKTKDQLGMYEQLSNQYST